MTARSPHVPDGPPHIVVPTRPHATLVIALAAGLLVNVAPAPAVAQAADAATSPEQEEVVDVVVALFDAMRARDGAAARALFHPDARLVTTGEQDGRPVAQIGGLDGFVEAIGSGEEPWDEKIYDVDVRVDGNMASVWNGYDFFMGDAFSHCGYDAFHLVRTDEGWKIIEVVDTRRTEGCPPGSSAPGA